MKTYKQLGILFFTFLISFSSSINSQSNIALLGNNDKAIAKIRTYENKNTHSASSLSKELIKNDVACFKLNRISPVTMLHYCVKNNDTIGFSVSDLQIDADQYAVSVISYGDDMVPKQQNSNHEVSVRTFVMGSTWYLEVQNNQITELSSETNNCIKLMVYNKSFKNNIMNNRLRSTELNSEFSMSFSSLQ